MIANKFKHLLIFSANFQDLFVLLSDDDLIVKQPQITSINQSKEANKAKNTHQQVVFNVLLHINKSCKPGDKKGQNHAPPNSLSYIKLSHIRPLAPSARVVQDYLD